VIKVLVVTHLDIILYEDVIYNSVALGLTSLPTKWFRVSQLRLGKYCSTLTYWGTFFKLRAWWTIHITTLLLYMLRCHVFKSIGSNNRGFWIHIVYMTLNSSGYIPLLYLLQLSLLVILH